MREREERVREREFEREKRERKIYRSSSLHGGRRKSKGAAKRVLGSKSKALDRDLITRSHTVERGPVMMPTQYTVRK
jgi:hypothetical protein